MNQYSLELIKDIAVNYFCQFSAPIVQELFIKALQLKPALIEKLKGIKSNKDLEEFFKEVSDVIELNANSGSIEINGALLEALKGVKFDHVNGTVKIANTIVSSDVIFTGGKQISTGTTIIGEETELKTKGTSIKVGKGCSITIKGNANIIQK